MKEDNSNSCVAEMECKAYYYDYYSHNCDTICDFFETDLGYYLLNYNNKMIYYSEKSELNFVILCNKPDCDHSGEDCNAYAGSHIGYYNGKIYSVSFSRAVELIRMNTDGTNHEKVADMPYAQSPSGVGQRSAGGKVFFYEGYIINFINFTLDKTTAYPVAYKIELETGKSTLLFDEQFIDCSSLISIFFPTGNKIWFSVWSLKEKESYYCCLNLDTNEITKKLPFGSDMVRISVENGMLYYYKGNTGFCEYNPETEEEKLLKQYDFAIANVVYGENNIFAKVWKTDSEGNKYDSQMIILDKEYNIIAQAELPTDNVTNMAFISVTSDYILLYEGNDVPTGITHYIDLNKITDGKMTVEKIQ